MATMLWSLTPWMAHPTLMQASVWDPSSASTHPGKTCGEYLRFACYGQRLPHLAHCWLCSVNVRLVFSFLNNLLHCIPVPFVLHSHSCLPPLILTPVVLLSFSPCQ